MLTVRSCAHCCCHNHTQTDPIYSKEHTVSWILQYFFFLTDQNFTKGRFKLPDLSRPQTDLVSNVTTITVTTSAPTDNAIHNRPWASSQIQVAFMLSSVLEKILIVLLATFHQRGSFSVINSLYFMSIYFLNTFFLWFTYVFLFLHLRTVLFLLLA